MTTGAIAFVKDQKNKERFLKELKDLLQRVRELEEKLSDAY